MLVSYCCSVVFDRYCKLRTGTFQPVCDIVPVSRVDGCGIEPYWCSLVVCVNYKILCVFTLPIINSYISNITDFFITELLKYDSGSESHIFIEVCF